MKCALINTTTMSPLLILLLVLLSVCYSDDTIDEKESTLGFYFSPPQIVQGFTESEENHSPSSCKWENAPGNGSNAMQCAVGVCMADRDTYSLHGTRRFTRCQPHYTLIGGLERDICRNGSWSSSGHECVQCGKTPKRFNELETIALVHNGYNSSKGDFPWMAALFKSEEGGRWAHLCGGTLISPDIVLTAAHCLDVHGVRASPEEIKVGLGRLSLYFDNNETGSVVISAKQLIIPERFVGLNRLYDLDIALVVLEQRVPVDDHIMPACIDLRGNKPPKHNDYGILAGWGLTDENGFKSETLKWTYQRYIGYQECTALMSGSDHKFLSPDKFCTDAVKGGLADSGDSGGGLTFQRGGRHYVYGVVSTKMYMNVRRLRLFTNLVNEVHSTWLTQEWTKLQTPSSTDAGVCCNGFEEDQDAFNIGTSNMKSAGSCQWESPPDKGNNFWQCFKGECQERVGVDKSNGTLRFTRCDPHHILANGSSKDTCVNGQWTSSGHLCISCGRSQNNFSSFDYSELRRRRQILPDVQGRRNSSSGDFPWMAAIYTRLDSVWEQICGGTLISTRIVLTAAHCVYIGGEWVLPKSLRVGLGKLYKLFYRVEQSSTISHVQDIVRSERYLGVDHLFDLDIALLVLKQNVVTGPYIMPACIDWEATMEPKNDELGYFAGWGTEIGTVLRWAPQKYMSYDKCLKMIRPRERQYLTQDKFCVFDFKGGKGGSGGGLTFPRDGAHYVYGVASTKLNADDKEVRLLTYVLNDGHLAWLRKQWQRIHSIS